MVYKYQVALSFAGEDRFYVEKVAELLKEQGISVFYDKFEQVDLWGKDLGIHFDTIYRRHSQYFIPFISTYYKEKIWTNYEVRNAIARAIESKEDYILPVKFDDTEIDGIRSTIGYIDAKNVAAEQLANAIIKKLGVEPNIPLPKKEEPNGNVYLSFYLLAYENIGVTGVDIDVTVTNTIKELRYFNEPLFKISKPLNGDEDTFQLMQTTTPITFPKRLEYGEQYKISYTLKKGFIKELKKLENKGVNITAFVTTTLGDKFVSNEREIDTLLELLNNVNGF
jgi:hypothetical protein